MCANQSKPIPGMLLCTVMLLCCVVMQYQSYAYCALLCNYVGLLCNTTMLLCNCFVPLPPCMPVILCSAPPSVICSKCISSFLLQFDLLQQLGFEGYAILINTNELQSHFIATPKGKNFHRIRQKQGKPLENPFIGYIFSEGAGELRASDMFA